MLGEDFKSDKNYYALGKEQTQEKLESELIKRQSKDRLRFVIFVVNSQLKESMEKHKTAYFAKLAT